MKKLLVVMVFLIGASVESFAQTYGLDNTDPAVFSKFTIPKTELSSLKLGTNFYYNSTKNQNLYLAGPNYDNFNYNLQYYLAPQYYLLRESDDSYLSANALLSGQYSKSYNNSEGPGVVLNNYTKAWSGNFDISGGFSFRNYASGSEMFYAVGSDVNVSLNNSYNDYRASDTTRSKSYRGMKTQNYTVSLGIGWGKMRDVTSVVSAIRFQERLKQLNLINSNLSEKAIEDLAQQFYREGYFSQVHVRPDKFFWQDVETALSGDGVSLTGLNQYADSYLREVPNELRFERSEGLVGGVNLQLDYVNNYQSYYPSGISEQFFTMANVFVDFSHQLNLNSQVTFYLSASGGPNITKHPVSRQQYAVNANAAYRYELTDRIVASVSDAFSVSFQNSGIQQKYLTDNAGVSMNYFVEDNVSLSASYSLQYSNVKNWYNYAYHSIETNNSVNIGLVYYFERGILTR